jgi:DNA polymerase III subunit epsilon
MVAMILFFDTETTGYANFKADETDPCQPRMVQLACILVDPLEREVAQFSAMIDPEGKYEIPDDVALIHGITTKRATEYGLPITIAIAAFNAMCKTASKIVAHNIPFDMAVIRSEIRRAGKPDRTEGLERFCTMRSSTDLCHLPKKGSRSAYKWPTLQELHQHCTGTTFDGAHDALNDVRALVRCYPHIITHLQEKQLL